MYQPIALTAAVTLDRDTHMGARLLLSEDSGFTVTLPAATGKGDTYRFYVKTTLTENTYVIAAAGTDVIQGVLSLASDVAGVTCPTTATSDKITLSTTTTGGLKGGSIILEDVSSGEWLVHGSLVTSGSEATPFSQT